MLVPIAVVTLAAIGLASRRKGSGEKTTWYAIASVFPNQNDPSDYERGVTIQGAMSPRLAYSALREWRSVYEQDKGERPRGVRAWRWLPEPESGIGTSRPPDTQPGAWVVWYTTPKLKAMADRGEISLPGPP